MNVRDLNIHPHLKPVTPEEFMNLTARTPCPPTWLWEILRHRRMMAANKVAVQKADVTVVAVSRVAQATENAP